MPLTRNLEDIRSRIDALCKAGARDPASVNLVAVSKQQPENRIREALDVGLRLFGENRLQEAQARWTSLRPGYPDLRLHLIGPLQTKKVKDAVALFDCIETIDRPALVPELVREMQKQNRTPACFIQINTGEEPQKSGVPPQDLPALLDVCTHAGLPISGLMCIPPQDDPPALHFALLKKLAERHGLPHLSMGMSADFEKAVPLGATHIRIGTALFGERPR